MPGIFLEGDNLVEEALEAGHPLEAVWFSEDFRKSRKGLISRVEKTGCPCREVGPRIMKSLTSLETPPGIVAVGPQPTFIFRKPDDPSSLIIVLCLVQDPGNLGGIIRTADYFGVDELWIGPGSADPYREKVLRGSMGALFRMPVVCPNVLAERLACFKDAGAEIWAAVAHAKDAEISIGPEGRRIVILGGESGGIDEKLLKFADRFVKIPGAGRGESLNLAVAAGILIYQASAGRWKGL